MIDGSFTTLGATQNEANAWLSVRVPDSSAVGYIAVWNRNDYAQYAQWLWPYELWVGNFAGDASENAVRCGATITEGAGQGPFVTACPAGTFGTYVTLRLVGWRRYLTIAELIPYLPLQQGAQAVATPGGGKGKDANADGSSPAPNYASLEGSLPDAPFPQNLAEAISLGLNVNEGSGCVSQSEASDHDHGAMYALIVLAACNLVAVLVVAWCVHMRRVTVREVEKDPTTELAAKSATPAQADHDNI